MRKSGIIETTGHYASSPFRASEESEQIDGGFDRDDYNAMNYAPMRDSESASLWQLSHAEDDFASAIAGIENVQLDAPGLPAPPTASLNDDERVGYVLDACMALSANDVALINQAARSDASGINKSALASLGQLSSVIQMSPAQNGRDSRTADGNPAKSEGATAPVSSGVRVTTVGSVQ